MAWTIAVALILIGGAGIFAFLASTMDSKEHGWLKVFFIFASLWAIMIATNVGINITESVNVTHNVSTIDPIVNRIGLAYRLQFAVLSMTFVWFFVYFIIKVFGMIKARKERKEDEI